MNIKQNLKFNMCLNAIKSLFTIIFPLITFPYATRVLGVDNIGKYNFSNSVITYFSLLAELGINTYAIREGARLRERRDDLNQFLCEIFSINIISTFISYVLLAICLFSVPKFSGYRNVIAIMSIAIIFKTIGIEYIYSIYEDYLFVTVRNIIFQIASLFMLFIFVKSPSNLIAYSIIYVISGSGANVINLLYAKKYCKIKFIKNMNFRRHIKPIMILFGMSATIAIYVASDVTILGFICNDTIVGQYSVSTKIYSIVKTLLSAIIVVAIPRLSALLGNNDMNGFKNTSEDIYKTLLTFMFPTVIGIIVLRKPIVYLIAGKEYMNATSSLLLLSVALFFCMGAWFWGQCILVPLQKEMFVFKVTIISAAINILFNFFLIPVWKENAAAFTTILAEGFSYFFCMFYGRKYINNMKLLKCTLKICIGCIFIYLICIGVRKWIRNIILELVISIISSIIVYILVETMLKNEVVYDVLNKIREKIFN